LSSPIKGEEIVFKEIGKPRPVDGVIHLETKITPSRIPGRGPVRKKT